MDRGSLFLTIRDFLRVLSLQRRLIHYDLGPRANLRNGESENIIAYLSSLI